MRHIQPNINFNGNYQEAMTFYCECVGSEFNFQTIGSSPIEANCPAEMKDKILHSTLINEELLLMGSDMAGPEGYIKGKYITLSINCTSEEEINSLLSKFSDGGKILDPLKVQFWGAMFGVVTDKFGIRWMLNFDKNNS